MDDNFNPDKLIDEINHYNNFTKMSKVFFDSISKATLTTLEEMEKSPDADLFDERSIVAAAHQYYVYIVKKFGCRELAKALVDLNARQFEDYFTGE